MTCCHVSRSALVSHNYPEISAGKCLGSFEGGDIEPTQRHTPRPAPMRKTTAAPQQSLASERVGYYCRSVATNKSYVDYRSIIRRRCLLLWSGVSVPLLYTSVQDSIKKCQDVSEWPLVPQPKSIDGCFRQPLVGMFSVHANARTPFPILARR